MKAYIKVTFSQNQTYIFCGRIKDQFYEPDKRIGLLDPYQRAEFDLSLREATDGQVML